MRTLVVLAVLAAAALVPSAGAGTVDPAALVLRGADLPHGYDVLRANTGRVSNADAAQGNRALARSFALWGRLTGYNVEYEGGFAGNIASSVDLFRRLQGAKAYLRWSVAVSPSRTGLTFRPLPNGPGDEAFFARKSFGGPPWVIVLWRFRGVFASASADTIGLKRTLALARVQQRRIAAALG